MRGQAQTGAAPSLPPSILSPKFPQTSQNVFHGITVIGPPGQEDLEMSIVSESERLFYDLNIGSLFDSIPHREMNQQAVLISVHFLSGCDFL